MLRRLPPTNPSLFYEIPSENRWLTVTSLVLVLVILFYCKIIDIYYLLKNIFIEYDTGDPTLIFSRNFTILAKPWVRWILNIFPGYETLTCLSVKFQHLNWWYFNWPENNWRFGWHSVRDGEKLDWSFAVCGSLVI